MMAKDDSEKIARGERERDIESGDWSSNFIASQGGCEGGHYEWPMRHAKQSCFVTAIPKFLMRSVISNFRCVSRIEE
jgi:hypothetical protein